MGWYETWKDLNTTLLLQTEPGFRDHNVSLRGRGTKGSDHMSVTLGHADHSFREREVHYFTKALSWVAATAAGLGTRWEGYSHLSVLNEITWWATRSAVSQHKHAVWTRSLQRFIDTLLTCVQHQAPDLQVSVMNCLRVAFHQVAFHQHAAAGQAAAAGRPPCSQQKHWRGLRRHIRTQTFY